MRENVHEQRVLDHLDLRVAHLRDQRPRDRSTGGIAAGVDDAGVRMGGLAAEQQCPLGVTVECDAAGDEFRDAGGAVVHENVDGRGIRKSRTRREGVGGVLFRRVARAIHARDAALGERGAAAAEGVLGHERRPMPRIRGVQCRGEPGDAGADDDDVHARGFAASIRSRAIRAGSATSEVTEI